MRSKPTTTSGSAFNVQATGDVVIDSLFNGTTYKYYMQGAKGYHGYGLQVVTNGDILLTDDRYRQQSVGTVRGR
jgi:hypothetical protein